MRVAKTLTIILLGLLSCKGNHKPVDKKTDTLLKVAADKKDTIQPYQKYVKGDFPADAVYPVPILTSGGVFHEDEIDPKSAEYAWMGLFRSDTGYYIANTKIKLAKAHDAVLDEDGGKTGWEVTPSVKDTALLLVSGLEYLRSKTVLKAEISKDQILPGEQQQFAYKGITYTLYATGNKKSSTPENDLYAVTNYKLFIKAVINGRQYNQMLVSVKSFDDTMATILFIGDLDGDNVPDVIIDTTNHYNVTAPTLYLSKPASQNDLLKVVGMHVTVGC